MRTIPFGNTKERVPVIGQGTWKMGLDPSLRIQEIDALQQGIEHGATLIDTAEVYSDGESERIVGEAIRDVRDRIFLVSKVWPTNGSYDGVRQAARDSLKRLGTDYMDLYLLHWPSVDYPIAETMRGMKSLVDEQVIRWIGVSNFTPELLAEAQDVLGDYLLTANQVVYHLKNRVIENDVLPYCAEHHITVMAYSPFGAGDFPEPGSEGRTVLDAIANKYGKTPYQVVLNWMIARGNIIAIPKAATPAHAIDNARATSFELTPEEMDRIHAAFPVPERNFTVTRK